MKDQDPIDTARAKRAEDVTREIAIPTVTEVPGRIVRVFSYGELVSILGTETGEGMRGRFKASIVADTSDPHRPALTVILEPVK